jgi:hypothetical protein
LSGIEFKGQHALKSSTSFSGFPQTKTLTGRDLSV